MDSGTTMQSMNHRLVEEENESLSSKVGDEDEQDENDNKDDQSQLPNAANHQDAQQEQQQQQQPPPPLQQQDVPIYHGHWTPWWVLGTVYLLLFIIYLGLREFGNATAGFILHTLVALLFVVACAWNLLHTPGHGPLYRRVHIWMGWTAVWSGVFVVVSGIVLVAKGQTSLSSNAQTMFIVTGSFQLVVQVVLIYFVRYYKSKSLQQQNDAGESNDGNGNDGTSSGSNSYGKFLFYHVVSANVLFFCCAFLPAANRAPQIFGFDDDGLTWTMITIPIGIFLTYLSIRHYAIQMMK